MADERRAHILVVEDDARGRQLLTEMLEHCRYYVTAVESGEMALRALHRTHYDLVVLDIMLPGMDGLTVAREIRHDQKLSRLPIVAVTALSGPSDASNVLEAGADAYISKPVQIDDVIDVVSDLLKGDEDPSSRYRTISVLGEGASKRVFLAHDSLLDRDVALSLIKTEGLDEAGRARILREARAMARLGAHPNIVTVFDMGERDGQPYIVTEVLDGGDVRHLLDDAGGALQLGRTLVIGKDVVRGLEFAHQHSIVHRDLKPGNVLLRRDGTAKLGDFGIAVALDRTRLTQVAGVIGTVHYMPPEQAVGGEVTPSSDLYSLGAMLYEMVTARPPFLSDDPWAVVSQHVDASPVAPSTIAPACPPALDALIMRLLAKSPADRPSSAGEVLNTLERIHRG